AGGGGGGGGVRGHHGWGVVPCPLRHARTGGAYDGHHRTAGIAGRTRRRGGGLAAGGARTAVERPTSSARTGLPCQQNRKGRSSCKSRRFSEQKFTGLRKAVMPTRRGFLIGAAAAGLPSIINSG